MSVLSSIRDHRGANRREFRCCDTQFVMHGAGIRTAAGVGAAQRTARRLEATLNAFDEESAVAHLNRSGTVENEHVARVVRRGLEY